VAPRRRAPARDQTVAELVRARRADLTPAELRAAQALLADYPAAGLQPVAGLAAHAGVSGPTVVRLVAKLGLAGYPDLQARLRAELSTRGAGSTQPEPPRPRGPGHLLTRFEQQVETAVSQTLRGVDPGDFDAATALLADGRRELRVAGGRASVVHALHLHRLLSAVRPGVQLVATDAAARAAALLDLGRAIVVAFDYPPHDDELGRFARSAAAAGAPLVLLTDQQLSPLAAAATVLLTTSIGGPPPFRTAAPALALVEALAVGATRRIGPSARRRAARLATLQDGLAAGFG
jgi:DNA-binding MurR/RpiR family transcriptional regulator